MSSDKLEIESYKRLTPVFICGHYRSGTSLINHLLDGHENVIASPVETKYFTDLLPRLKNSENEELAVQETLLRHFYTHKDHMKKSYGDINAEKFLIEYSDSLSKFQKDRGAHLDAYMMTCTLNHPYPSQLKLWVEKTPMNEIFTKEILERWPMAKFIHVIRDPRDMHATIRTRSRFPLKPRTTAHNWRRSLRARIENEKNLGPSVQFTLSYEDLAKNPEVVMRKLAQFLSIEFTDSLLHPSSGFGSNSWDGNAFNQKHSGITTNSLGKWRAFDNPEEIKMIESVVGREMNLLGYKTELDKSLFDWVNGTIQQGILVLKGMRYAIMSEKRGTY